MTKKQYTATGTFQGQKIFQRSTKSQKDADQRLAIKMQKLQEGTIVQESTMPLHKWVSVCYDKYKGNVKEETKKIDRIKANRWIVEPLGKMPLNAIRQSDIQDVLNSMAGYSDAHIKKVMQLYKWVFKKAIENRLLNYNPTEGLTRPRGTKKHRRAITEQERHHLWVVADKEPKLRFYLFMLCCGCRPSEVAHIKAMDIQIKNGTPFLHIEEGKSVNAKRDIPIPASLYERIPKDKKPWEYLFTTNGGNPLDEQERKRLWKRCKRELNISMGCKVYRNKLVPPYPLAMDLTPYCFRHTYCTDLKNAGVDIRDAQYLMGHSDISLTANIYTHSEPTSLSTVADRIDHLQERKTGQMKRVL